MNYILSTKKNNDSIVKYEYDISADYTLFMSGRVIEKLQEPLIYTVARKEDVKKMKKFHWLSSTGPDLVSDELRKIIEEVAGNDVEFFDVTIMFEDEKIEGFSAINLKYKTDCLDMKQSEFKLTNFDPVNPTYMFYYMVVLKEDMWVNIVRCKEMPRTIVVNKKLKQACFDAKLKGLTFCQSLDMTYQQRTICEET